MQEREPHPTEDEVLREEDVTSSDRLDDRIEEAEGLPEEDDYPREREQDR